MLSRVWPLQVMPAQDFRCSSAAGDISQHMIRNDDWSLAYLFDYLGLRSCSQRRFFDFLEECVHPLSVEGEPQELLVLELNERLVVDGFELVATEVISGRTVYSAKQRILGVSGRPKNLIFASDGPKPDLVLSDAINNDVRIVRHADHCLVFDRPVPTDGLTWCALVDWWAAECGHEAEPHAERRLFDRLRRSLASPPEGRLFGQFFRRWRRELGDALPALIPQVYLHYDPQTIRQRAQAQVLPRQRMDFLLLFSAQERVVIEVDGKQHYADGDRASTERYARMVAADRELRLLGYEVYRFGGAELAGDHWKATVDDFFARLFAKHRRA